ncbi:PDZ domain-containing protein [Asticcacaulis sp.]|uniref:PDZ domain-containing protein n=1 Tax=Asticcacaulis sp. TaxID=1872648 RepID=UPI002CACAB5F|nr:PDZ domain-containing protein [Asticcacaulis sp.]HTM79789.1 PDZ domain-containing protein [Asticcacaulis sp.]
MRIAVVIVSAMILLPLPAVAGTWQIAETPSGRAEAIFLDYTPAEASGLLADGCINAGWIVVSSTPNEVKCEVKLNFGQQLVKELFQGNRYSTPVKQYLRTTISQSQDGARAQAYLWDETQFAFGQIRTTPQDGDGYVNRMQSYLVDSGGALPKGTKFTNFAYLGITGDTPVVQVPYNGKLAKGLRVTNLQNDGSGAKAGLQAGDVILRVADKRTDSDQELMEGLNKAARQGSLSIEVFRGQMVMNLSGPVIYRPAVSEYDPDAYAKREVQKVAVVDATPAPSAADELLKYGTLLEKGLISKDEYDVQKKRLLGQ